MKTNSAHHELLIEPTHSIHTIQCCYARFLLDSSDPEDADQIREVLIHAHYLSQQDIEICAAFDICDPFDTHPNFPGIESLHQALQRGFVSA